MGTKLYNLFCNLAQLRYEIQDGGTARRHRYKVYDRLQSKVLAKFDEVIYAQSSLKQYQDNYIQELDREYSTELLSVA